ncbi:MAG: hypothetical protein KA171_00510 [Reyranella sp.]|nr:hypothetical protein [Reyranella sp.]
MHEVGEYLRDKALESNADLFGRSAFNRYYYAAYLSARELLQELDPKWAASSHKAIPDLMEGIVVDRLKAVAKRQGEHGIVNSAYKAASEIANVLRTAYAVRVVADYQPNNRVEFSNGTFKLVEHSAAEAASWARRVDTPKGTLLRLYRKLGIV